MNLEDITVKIRPRDSWEAIDLGFKLTQKYWRAVYLPWLIFFLPLVCLITWGLQDWPIFSLALIWWLKPVYDRLLLSVYSRALFNDTPNTEQTLRSLLVNLKTQLFSALTYQRLSLSRSFTLPVTQLEQLQGANRSARCNILSLQTSGHAIWLTTICKILELLISISLIGFVYLLIPETYQMNLDSLFEWQEYSFKQSIAINALYAIGVLIIEPFYVAGGFMLYINRRTILEAWDIELSFRKLEQRISSFLKNSSSAILIILLCLPLFNSTPSFAEDIEYPEQEISDTLKAAEDSGLVVESIYARDEMGQKDTEKYLKYIGETPDEDDDNEFNFDGLFDIAIYMAHLFKIILVIAVLILVAALFLNRDKWLHLLGIGKAPEEESPSIETLFGMDLRPDSLPKDIAGSARALLEKNDIRGALSLLYRGVLSVLVNTDELPIHQAHTENEILSLAGQSIHKPRNAYLNALTNEWMLTAYSQSISAKDQVSNLCDRWSEFEVSE